jgi:hypothetical protein
MLVRILYQGCLSCFKGFLDQTRLDSCFLFQDPEQIRKILMVVQVARRHDSYDRWRTGAKATSSF